MSRTAFGKRSRQLLNDLYHFPSGSNGFVLIHSALVFEMDGLDYAYIIIIMSDVIPL